jgi:lipopolysaccharide/colanic/teichoic acid biosynthesis glycosyltransferase
MSKAQQAEALFLNAPVQLRIVPPAARRGSFYQRLGKRAFDLAAASVLLLIAAPLMLAAALAVRISMGSGVVFRQRRVGHGGRDFDMVKFRTMKPSRRSEQREWAGPDRRVTHKSSADPRHTVVGRVLRKTSLDELPQLIHVVRGEMSLVGPRPEISAIVDREGLRNHVRHSVRPGLTGHWQISHRGTGEMLHECFDVDIDYATNVTFRRDLSLLVQTVSVVAKGS